MSDYLAVAGVSAVLRTLLTSALPNDGPATILGTSPGISSTSPDLIVTGPGEQPRLNIFMYYASFNAALRNLGLPAANAQGLQVSNPPLALNLHYLVSAYGGNQFDPEILLAWAMQVFHETPVVPRQVIQDALTGLGTATPEGTLIGASTLADQIEHIKITPETLTTEEIYRLWAAFQTHYRPTTSYRVSVVVIQRTRTFKSNLPVQQRTVTAAPLQPPVIDQVSPAMITAGGTLTITGRNFLGDSAADTLVSFDSEPGVAPSTLQGNCVRVVLPATLQAGVRSLRVVRNIVYPAAPAPHTGFASSPARFQLIPTITNAPPITVAHGSNLTLQVSPSVGQTQRATLYIGDNALPLEARAVTAPATSPTLDFAIPANFRTGTFPLRLEIDGASSALTLDTTPGSPTQGQLLPQGQVT
jgi:Pvc16 N-terminal domain/IPT/TIG domain